MAAAIENAIYTYRLTAVYDLREWDEAAESYLDILDDEKSMCAHCGRLHAKVYEVTREQDGAIFTLGSSCSRKHLSGWEPEKEEVRRLAKEAEKLAKSRAHQKLLDLAAPIVAEVAALIVPEIISVGTKYGHPAYGMANSAVSIPCRDGLTEERRRCCIDIWKREQVRLHVQSIENDRKRQKVQAIVCGELGV